MPRKTQKTEVEPEAAAEPPVSGKKIVLAIIVIAVAFVLAVIIYRQRHRYDAFAHCLTDRHVLMYGAYWCPHCAEQKEKFGASFKYAPYVECGIPGSRGEQQVCKDAGIKHFPTWQFPPVGERVEGTLSLEDLSDRTGCPLP